MLQYIAFAFCLAVMFSCNNNKEAAPDNKDTTATAADQPADTISKTPRNLCFNSISGGQQKDSTTVNLSIDGRAVTGLMNIVIYEKDARRGTLSGTITSDSLIHAVFSYMQEGMQDTIAVEFKLTAKALLQKPYILNTATGRDQSDAAADYSISLPRVDCK